MRFYSTLIIIGLYYDRFMVVKHYEHCFFLLQNNSAWKWTSQVLNTVHVPTLNSANLRTSAVSASN